MLRWHFVLVLLPTCSAIVFMPPPSSRDAVAKVQRRAPRSAQVVALQLSRPAEAPESANYQVPEDDSTRMAVWNRRFPIQWRVLSLLVLQNSVTTCLVRRTRQPHADGSILYLGGAAVLVSEVLKLLVCLVAVARSAGGLRGLARELRYTFSRVGDTARMGVTALSYGLQNQLYYVALSHMSATSYQLWSQTKILFTALFFVNLLGQQLRPRQWLALGLLAAGVGLVQLADAAGAAAAGGAATSVAAASGLAIGIAAVLTSSILSGFASVYLEKALKQAQCEIDAEGCDVQGARREPMSLWLRNVQLGAFAIPQAALLLLASPSSRAVLRTHGVLAGFTPVVWLATALTAIGGLLVATVVKHTNTVLKTYATATAILVTCIATATATRAPPSPGFVLGLGTVLFSMGLYNGVSCKAVLRKWLSRRRKDSGSKAT